MAGAATRHVGASRASRRVAGSAALLLFHAIGDLTRRRMLDLLLRSERSVTELSRPFRMSQPAISQHLRILREADLVKTRREGRRRLYRVNPKPVEQVYLWAKNYHEFADPAGHVWRVAEVAPAQAAGLQSRQQFSSATPGGFHIWLPDTKSTQSTFKE